MAVGVSLRGMGPGGLLHCIREQVARTTIAFSIAEMGATTNGDPPMVHSSRAVDRSPKLGPSEAVAVFSSYLVSTDATGGFDSLTISCFPFAPTAWHRIPSSLQSLSFCAFHRYQIDP